MSKRSFKKAFKVADEWTTPSCLVNPIIPELKDWARIFVKTFKREPVIWCPFDTVDSKYVEILQIEGFNVVFSHISEGKDFFYYEPDQWDIAISNPPFSIKLDVFRRLTTLNKPFLMLMNMMAINYQEIGEFFYTTGEDIQFIIPDKKVSFDGNTSSFCSGYVCYKFVDRTKFVHLDNNNSKGFFKE